MLEQFYPWVQATFILISWHALLLVAIMAVVLVIKGYNALSGSTKNKLATMFLILMCFLCGCIVEFSLYQWIYYNVCEH